jgi:imidazolonepropionase (EC 3.5.2.7)
MRNTKLIGPFRQLLTMDNLPAKGPLQDSQLEIIAEGAIAVADGKILEVGLFGELLAKYQAVEGFELGQPEGDFIALPGLIDAHTHICFAGTRAADYAMRLGGKSYLEMAESGGGIWHTVTKTREALPDELVVLTMERAKNLLRQGVTTVEVKSGYGLNADAELKMVEAIRKANALQPADLIPTCLAAHIVPRDFKGSASEYLESVQYNLLPLLKERKLTHRVDIFIDHGAFGVNEAEHFLRQAKAMGFDLVIHGDQFVEGGARLAAQLGALSVDHLESVSEATIQLLALTDVVTVALPGASMGLGCQFTPARKLLNAGCTLAIASDWNPGSAPMGELLMQAAVLGAFERLTMAETLAAVTCRAAQALNLKDRGILQTGMLADFIAFPIADYREVLYCQGALKPTMVWKRGALNDETDVRCPIFKV